MPEENETGIHQLELDVRQIESRNAFSSPQERTDYNNDKSPFGRPSKKQNLSQCLLLGPQNLNKLFDNQNIINNSDTLFVRTGYFNRHLKSQITNKNTILVETDFNVRTLNDILNDLNYEQQSNHMNDEHIIELFNELYDFMENDKLLDGKICSKIKIQILKCLYKFVESKNDQLLICIGKIILAVRNFH